MEESKTLYHKDYEVIKNLVSLNIPTLLSGPAGAGKNITLKQVADGLGLPFYFTNAVTQEYKLTGFIDANGTYHETQFYQAFKNGGLFFLDEMDASIPETLVILNAAIANGYFDFPTERVEAHEDFRIVGAANTFGTGADIEYVGRNQLDAATLDRFALIRFDYDPKVENAIADNEDISTFIQEIRRISNDLELHLIVSMRATKYLRKLQDSVAKPQALMYTLYKGLSKEDITQIYNEIKIDKNNPYVVATGELIGIKPDPIKPKIKSIINSDTSEVTEMIRQATIEYGFIKED